MLRINVIEREIPNNSLSYKFAVTPQITKLCSVEIDEATEGL